MANSIYFLNIEVIFLCSIYHCNISAIGADTLMSPESVVSWLLEHPEVAAEDSDSLSSVYDSDTESVSYENGLAGQGLNQFVS